MKQWILCSLLAVLLAFAPLPTVKAAVPDALEQAWQAAQAVEQKGPKTIALGNQGSLNLPPHFVFIPQTAAQRIMKAMGNGDCPEMLGLIMSDNPDDTWMVSVDYTASGYINDEDTQHWNTDDLYESVRRGTEEGNKERRALGQPAMHLVGWAEKPQYDPNRHYLIWSVALQEDGEKDTTINYNTYVLGREGYLTLMLVTDGTGINRQKTFIKQLLQHTQFVAGKRYGDFQPGSDRMAEYGLASLIY